MKKLTSMILTLMVTAATITFNTKTSIAADTLPITRGQAEERALNMINVTWNYSKDRNSKLDEYYSSLVTQPDQLKSITNGTVQGIPYNWGGLDSIDSHSDNTPWSNFLSAVNNGAYIGNVNTEAGCGYIPGTAGIDCSGFVQATFNIKDYKISTSTMFDKYFTQIDLNNIKHMDILDRPGDHVVIFDKWGTLNGVYGAFTYESTPDVIYGGIQGTKKYFLSMDEINNGYIPGRYVNIVEDSQNQLPKPVEACNFAKVSNVNFYANLRMSPSATSSIVGTIPKDTIVYLIDYSLGWYQISYNGKVSWIYGSLIAPIESGKYVTVNSVYQLNIRSNPSIASSIVGCISRNQYGEVLDYSSDGKWIKIKVNGVIGWSSRTYLSYIY